MHFDPLLHAALSISICGVHEAGATSSRPPFSTYAAGCLPSRDTSSAFAGGAVLKIYSAFVLARRGAFQIAVSVEPKMARGLGWCDPDAHCTALHKQGTQLPRRRGGGDAGDTRRVAVAASALRSRCSCGRDSIRASLTFVPVSITRPGCSVPVLRFRKPLRFTRLAETQSVRRTPQLFPLRSVQRRRLGFDALTGCSFNGRVRHSWIPSCQDDWEETRRIPLRGTPSRLDNEQWSRNHPLSTIQQLHKRANERRGCMGPTSTLRIGFLIGVHPNNRGFQLGQNWLLTGVPKIESSYQIKDPSPNEQTKDGSFLQGTAAT